MLVAQSGRVLLRKGYGLASIAGSVPFDSHTRFRIGSLSKPFFAAGILKLQDEGKLATTDRLAKYFPDFPNADRITVHDLLTHTDGLPNYSDGPDILDVIGNPTTSDAILQRIRARPAGPLPGSRFAYGNTGYYLLGLIIEKVTGKTLDVYMQEAFFRPLGMKGSFVYPSKRNISEGALGYEWKDGAFRKSLDWHLSWAGAAGAVVTNAEDLFRWSEALRRCTVLAKQSCMHLFQPATLSTGLKTGYGYGWYVTSWKGRIEHSHTGAILGFSSVLMMFPQEQITVILLLNGSWNPQNLDATAIAHGIADIYLSDASAHLPRANLAVPSAVYVALAGRYDFATIGLQEVTQRDNRLFIGPIGAESPTELLPISELEYFARSNDGRLTFVRNDGGTVIGAGFCLGGMSDYAEHLDDTIDEQVDPAGYDAFVGEYDFGPGSVIAIRRDGGRLLAKWGTTPEFEIYPHSSHAFFWKVTRAEIVFNVNAQGKVEGATMYLRHEPPRHGLLRIP